ncbi:MAG TPA: GGDEF domain-containing protein, partial [Spirochaetota bacterium]
PEILDNFEKKALSTLSKGKREVHDFEYEGSSYTFRYVVPLYYDQRVMHQRGVAVTEGRLFGGISVSIDASDAVSAFIYRSIIIISVAIAGVLFFMLFISSLFRKLGRRVHRAQEHIRTYGFSDPLTGALNIKSVNDRFNEEVAKTKRLKHPLSIILVDIDHLKRINERYGFQSGNRILRSFVSLVRTDLRPYDIIGRLGGEEFLLILPGLTHAEAQAIAERLRGKTSLECAMLSGIPGVIEVTASFGVSAVDEHTDTAEAVLRRAERALKKAKSEGRNRVEGI